MTDETVMERMIALRREIELRLPDFVEACRVASEQRKPVVFSQEAFCVDYDEDELRLLGMVIKYAGLFKIPILILSQE